MKRFYVRYLGGLISALLLFSCASRKEVAYFQNIDQAEARKAAENYEPKFQSDDLLAITVSAFDMDAVRPFNLPAVAHNAIPGSVTGELRQQAYLIDSDGHIEFPVLGKIKMAGLDRKGASGMLKTKLAEYIKDPIVNIRIINFKVTVLGEVKNPGTYNIQNERITVLEALGLAGDLDIQARRDNVLLIRDNGGNKIYKRIDLTSSEILSSPFYYLDQNDVIYVEPKESKIKSSAVGNNTFVVVSILSTLVSSLAIILSR